MSLRTEGWDVSVRGVRAFSTGGWFSDPIVSSMFTDSDNAFGYLVNILLHESLHATVLIENQQFYNESLASFVGDQMTLEYLAQRFGAESEVMLTYLENERRGEQAEQLLANRYQQLEALYASALGIEEKLLKKQKIMRELYVRLGYEDLPTNATLLGTRLYGVGQTEFLALLTACGNDWRRFIRVTGSVVAQHFSTQQLEAFGGIVDAMAERQCEPLPRRSPSRYRLRE
jgi:predicted aminopeptidase